MKSKIKTEAHVHTIASDHAYSTLGELLSTAASKQVELLAMTDHGPGLPDGAHPYHFSNSTILPRKPEGVYLIRGAETNIMDFDGTVDLSQRILAKLDWVIASFHAPCISPGTVEDHTNAYIKVLENPYIDMIAHSGSPAYAYDIDKVLMTAKHLDKVIEINEHTFSFRPDNVENCKQIARRCAELGVWVCISTDTHSVYDIGNTELSWALAMEAGIREEQIVNINAERFLSYICRRRGLDRASFETIDVSVGGNSYA